MLKKDRYKHFIDYFSEHAPEAKTELNYSTPYELLVAVILSAQCTDKRVNMTTPILLKRFPSPIDMAESTREEVYKYIRNISYPNNKAKHLVEMARILVQKFNSVVPSSVEELMQLPGVGRKTANVVVSVAFGKPAMAVDTHVFRVSDRIGLTHNAKTPLDTEHQLVENIPLDKLNIAHHWIILHGRYVCLARKPKCNECGLKSFCRYFESKISKTFQ